MTAVGQKAVCEGVLTFAESKKKTGSAPVFFIGDSAIRGLGG